MTVIPDKGRLIGSGCCAGTDFALLLQNAASAAPTPGEESTQMPMKRPDPTHVYLSVVNMLRDHGMSRLSGMVDCRVLPALAFPTYLVIAAGEARAFVAAMLERVLGREFPLGEARWVLEAEEARRLADYPALVSI